jgi:FkbM family methyltransferase
MQALIKKLARYFGIDVKRYAPQTSDVARQQALLSSNHIDMIFDIGANVGQYASQIRSGGYKGKIVSFEPLSDAYAQLLQNSRKDADWIVAPRAVVGDEDRQVDINISENSLSSSIMPMLQSHIDAHPSSRYLSTQKVTMSRLDTIAPQYLNPTTSAYLKIDTQGAESKVLDGASQTLPRIKGIQIELSFVPLYEGQPLFLDIVHRLLDLGFDIHGILPVFIDPETGRLLQADGIFFRR